MSAAFRCTLAGFNDSTTADKIGCLAEAEAKRGFATHQNKQTDAWRAELLFLGAFVQECRKLIRRADKWHLILEYDIPRRGRRPDAILLADDLIFVLEFKIGASAFLAADRWQARSYALDLRDFHYASNDRRIVPVLIATRARSDCRFDSQENDLVLPVQQVGDDVGTRSARIVCELYNRLHDATASTIDAEAWVDSPYRPTPTIIEAAQALFAGHNVNDISHSFACNLDKTCSELLAAIKYARDEARRVICFVTGIPGAGKTLAGLNVVHDRELQLDGRPRAVFLSGNGPLVKIVREALVRDRMRAGMKKGDAQRTVATFIDNVHGFIREYAIKNTLAPPYENAIVFDEAQRAWSADAAYKKHELAKSEPEMVLEIMERAPGWSAIVCLVGGGQEINQGEAGLGEWGRALKTRPVPWRVYASPAVIVGDDSVAGQFLFSGNDHSASETNSDAKAAASARSVLPVEVVLSPSLHLAVSVRSPRARKMSEWVNQLLMGNSAVPSIVEDTSAEFPIVLTRDLDCARDWLRHQSEGVQSTGLLASSGALRLRAHGLEVSTGFRHDYRYDEWFLAEMNDLRASNWLEVVATEFECQGLELEWTGVCWGGDFVFSSAKGEWLARKFRGTKWQNVRRKEESQYILNKYRVLLTRARRGMIIWIPQGNSNDPTREPELFDATADLLSAAGIPSID